MKTKFLFSACAFAAFLAGCSSDDFLAEVQEPVNNATMEEVVGADLASKGMKVVLGTETRVNENGWEDTDVIGMGWYNLARNIYDEQPLSSWNNTSKVTDYKIYANDMFYVNNGNFETKANIYQGAHFLYFPYEYQSKIDTRTFDVNAAVQTEDFEKEVRNKALHLSAQDYIEAEKIGEDGVLTKEFVLAPVVSAIKVVAAPQDEIKENETMKGYAIRKMEIAAANAFKVSTGVLKPSRLPKAIYKITGELDREATEAEMKKGANLNQAFSNTQFVNVLTTTINSAELNLSDTKMLRAFTLPTNEKVATTVKPTITIHVGRQEANGRNYDLGYFTADETTEGMTKLKAALTTGVNDKAELTLKNVLCTNTNLNPLSLPVALLAKDFTACTGDIKSVEQWNDLADLYDALVAILGEKNVQVPTFTLGEDLTFKGEIKTPESIGVKFATNEYTLTVEDEVEWPANLTAATSEAKVVVKKEATLTVNTTLDATIVNNGTIKAGPVSSISTKESKKLDNKDGRVIVEYGAYVYPEEDKNGVVAYEVKNNRAENIGKINTLIANNGNQEYASVNTLIVSTSLNLNAPAKSSDGDRYNPSAATTLNSLENIDIELVNGSISYTTGQNTTVKNIVAVKGNKNVATDVEVSNGIATEKGATLTVDSKAIPQNTLEVVVINNYGTLNVDTPIATEQVNNFATGIIYSNEGIQYTKGYQQDGMAKGVIVKVAEADSPAVAKAKDIATAIAGVNMVKTYAAWVEKLNDIKTALSNGDDSVKSWGSYAVYTAINEWYTSQNLDGLEEQTISTNTIKLIETATGVEFGLE